MSVLEWMAYKSATALVGLSPGIKQGIERLNISSDKVAMIPNGCDLTIFDEKCDAWVPEGVEDSDLMAVFTGTHGQANGLDNALLAAKVLQQRNRKDIKLVLIGDGKLKASLVKDAQRDSLTNIIFLDPVKKSKLALLMNRADVGMQLLANIPAFYYGTSPNKFFDYIASGLPILNNYPGWLADMITEHNLGLAIKPDNPESFADALEWFADNKVQLPKMSQAASNLAKNEFDRSKLADCFVD